MYLLVFITLIIGLVGIYAQVVSLEAARIASNMTGLAKNMIIWHSAAISMGASIVDTGSFTSASSPCSLTYTLPTAVSVVQCPAPLGSGSTTGTVTDASGNRNQIVNRFSGTPETVHLPSDFDATKTQFYSILYYDSSSSQSFVVTFVLKPTLSATNPAPGYLALPPSKNLISYTTGDLLHQLSLSGLPKYSYGTVKTTGVTSVLESPSFQRGLVTFEYNMPGNGSSPLLTSGVVGMVSSVAGF